MLSAVFVAAMLVSAAASSNAEFTISAPADGVAAWLQTHPDSVSRASGCTVLWRQGDRSCLRKDTPIGPMEFVVQQRVVGGKGRYALNCWLVESLHGRLRAQSVSCQLTSLGPRLSRCTISLYADVDRVPQSRMQRAVDDATQQAQFFLQGFK